MTEPFSSVLRDYRIAAGLSQEALAELANLSPATISTLERSARKAPQRQTIALLAEGLRLSPDDRARLESAAANGRSRGPRNAVSGRRAQPNNLPNLLTSFHGREKELQRLRTLVQSRRLITLVGTGGVGKTRLAIESARECLAEGQFRDGLFIVDFSTFNDSNLISASIAAALRIPERPTQELLETLGSALQAGSTLLIFDNCEHVIEEAARVAENLLQRCAGLHILATSREALRLDGESVVPVEPLALEGNQEAPAVRLFLDRVSDSEIGQRGALSASDSALVQEICVRLDGLPLALELAAARAHDLPLSSIVARLDERFTLLDRGRRTADRRQQTIHGAIDWSYTLLKDSEQKLLRELAVFTDSFTSEAAVAVCEDGGGAVRGALTGLIAKSLLTVVEDEAGSQRYRMLETIRAYALELLSRYGEQQTLSRRHACYYCELPKRLTAQHRFEFPRHVVLAVEPELANVHEALRWAFDKADPAFVVEIAAWSGIIFWHLSFFAEGVRWCDRALSLNAELPPAVAARLWLSLSQNLFNLGNMRRSFEAARNATVLYEHDKDLEQVSTALNGEAHALYQLGEIADARRIAKRSLSIARALEDDLLIGRALRMAAVTNDPGTAREYMREALARYRA
ncbi:MAG: helix-turn-helix domain-containing protein, partial [Candidatus Eremiobacteraeota bacterium]|nr:helix-turn-helix domain-containing protein [Candidatus Eremiobacteraeota bacterium]